LNAHIIYKRADVQYLMRLVPIQMLGNYPGVIFKITAVGLQNAYPGIGLFQMPKSE
jgi:hypothetical protein